MGADRAVEEGSGTSSLAEPTVGSIEFFESDIDPPRPKIDDQSGNGSPMLCRSQVLG
jgi:hypothetical protein